MKFRECNENPSPLRENSIDAIVIHGIGNMIASRCSNFSDMSHRQFPVYYEDLHDLIFLVACCPTSTIRCTMSKSPLKITGCMPISGKGGD